MIAVRRTSADLMPHAKRLIRQYPQLAKMAGEPPGCGGSSFSKQAVILASPRPALHRNLNLQADINRVTPLHVRAMPYLRRGCVWDWLF